MKYCTTFDFRKEAKQPLKIMTTEMQKQLDELNKMIKERAIKKASNKNRYSPSHNEVLQDELEQDFETYKYTR